MQFIHSNKKYIERTMYPINPYINTPAVAPLTMEAFVAPANFDADAQELNIVTAFATYPDVNKKYIFSVGNSATTVLPAVTGRSYAYAENGGGYTTIASGTVTWTVGSTKRNVVVIDSAGSVAADIPIGGVWSYLGKSVRTVYSFNNTSLKYIHMEMLALDYIPHSAFYSCSSLSGNLTIPNNVAYIEDSGFRLCTGIYGDLIIPASITNIKNSAFNGCSGFNGNLILNSGLTNISEAAFQYCTGLKGNLTIPSTVINIGSFTFNGCTGFNGNLILNSGLISIKDNAFKGCSGFIGSLNIPLSVNEIGEAAFFGCSGFTGNLNIPEGVTTLGLFTFMDCSNINGTLTLPNSLKTIGDIAFYRCSKISKVIIGSGILSIGNSTFNSVPMAQGCYIHAITAPTVNSENTFVGYSRPLHIPVSSTGYGVAPWTNTSMFTNIIADL